MPSRPNLIEGRLSQNIWSLAWPNTVAQFFMMLPGVYDAIWLGQLGPEAQAAAGLAVGVRMTMISVLMALSLAGGAVVARYVGAGDRACADRAALHAVLLMLTASTTLGVIGIVLARPLMRLAGADGATLELAVRYAQILFGGLIALEMVPSVGFMLNAAGAPQMMMIMSLIAVVFLLIGEPVLVYRFGIEGAAFALTGGYTLAMAWGLWILVSGRGPVQIDLRHARLEKAMFGRILRIAVPAVIQRGVPNLIASLMMRLISAYGTASLAAWMVVERVFNMATVPCMGLSRAAPAMVGQNLGADKPQRAVRATHYIGWATALVALAIIGVLAMLAPQAVSLFSNDAETVAIGARAIRLFGIGALALNLGFVFDAALGGAGDTLVPMLLNIVALLLIQVPLACTLPDMANLGADGIWIALVAGRLAQALLLWARFRQGHWQRTRI